MEVRYEDVIQDPEAAMREVCAFLEIPYADQMMNYHLEVGAPDTEHKGKENQRERNWKADKDHEQHGSQHDQSDGRFVHVRAGGHEVRKRLAAGDHTWLEHGQNKPGQCD